MNIQYSIILAFVGQMRDRFATYQEPRGPGEKLALASKTERQLSQLGLGSDARHPNTPRDYLTSLGARDYVRWFAKET
jgi:hypothetical protein